MMKNKKSITVENKLRKPINTEDVQPGMAVLVPNLIPRSIAIAMIRSKPRMPPIFRNLIKMLSRYKENALRPCRMRLLIFILD